MNLQTNFPDTNVESVIPLLFQEDMEFHIFPSRNESFFELQVPDENDRIQFSSLFAAARYARKYQDDRDATVIIHDPSSNRVNRIPILLRT